MTHFVPPYPKPIVKRGFPLDLVMRPFKFIRSRYCSLAVLIDRSYGMHLGETRTAGHRMYIANQPDLVKRVLVDEWENFPKSDIVADMLELLMGDSIFVSNGEVWKRQRRMMEPAFEQARIKIVFDMMLQAVDALADRIAIAAGASETAIDAEMTHVTADIIFRTIFSKPLSAAEARLIYAAFIRFQETAYARGMTGAAGFPKWVSVFGYRKARQAASEIRAILDPLVRARHDSFHSGEAQTHQDILQSLISVKDGTTGTHFDYRELCEQVAMLFLAGHETSASALSWAFYLLANDQDIQERLHLEAVKVLGTRAPRFSDMRRLGLARNVFSETLRLYPPVAFLPRRAAKTCPMRDKIVAANSVVSISPWLIHRHRRYWREPDAFDPGRFDRDETAEALRQSYLPFSKGPRVCLGAAFALQEGTLILACLARRFKFDTVPGFVPKPVGRLTVRSENGIRLRVTKRPLLAAQ